ncbi:MAG: excinuclease ABC subunit UvrA, partial [Ignavibacteria bacterium]
SLSSYARQFLGVIKRPDVDVIEGLSPAISIEQKSIGLNPRSTVGTVTEIYDFLRLLYAKVGVQYCTTCAIPVRQQTLDQIIDAVLLYPLGTRIQILSPVVKGRKGHYREQFESYRRQGFTRVRVNGEIREITEGMQLQRYKTHTIELVIDRLNVDPATTKRLQESIESALHLGEGGLTILVETSTDVWIERFFSTDYSCPQCGESYQTPAPNMFSFNSPFGACPTCDGLGELVDFDPVLVVPDHSLSIASGGIAPLGKKRDTWLWKQVAAWCQEQRIDIDVPIQALDEVVLTRLLYGTDEAHVSVEYGGSTVRHSFLGVLPSLRHQYNNATTATIRKSIEKFFSTVQCRTCSGGRLRVPNMHVLIDGNSITKVSSFDIDIAQAWFDQLPQALDARQNQIAQLILREITSRLSFLVDVGLAYMTLDRSARTLSGGESQRIRLASQIGSRLVGVTYVL